jgi:hypothetical protein
VIQQGQVFKLQARCVDGEPLWADRYRVAGRGSARLQVGGFSSKAEAQRALQNKLGRLLPDRRAAALTPLEIDLRKVGGSTSQFDALTALAANPALLQTA